MKNVDTSNPVVKKYLREFLCSTEFDPEIRVCCSDEKLLINNDVSFKDVHERFWHISLPEPDSGECGQDSLENKIVGGSETSLGEYPWIALFKYIKGNKIQYACSGSLVNEQYVVTAAHCVDPDIIARKDLGKLYASFFV